MFKVILFNVKQYVYLHGSVEIYTIRQKMSKKNTDIKNDIRPLYVRWLSCKSDEKNGYKGKFYDTC